MAITKTSLELKQGTDGQGNKVRWADAKAGSTANSDSSIPISTNSGAGSLTIDVNAALSNRIHGDFTPECGFPTKTDGTPCELPGTRDDGRCHHHEGLTPDCGYPTDKDGSPCELPGTRGRRNRCHLHEGKCNESMKHDHAQKAAFHALKGAYRYISDSSKGIVNDGYKTKQIWPAYHIAKGAAIGYLQAVGEEYDRDKSISHYEDNVLDEVDAPANVDGGFHWDGRASDEKEVQEYYAECLRRGIRMAWQKVDNGSHVGGARVAIAAVEHFSQRKVEVRA